MSYEKLRTDRQQTNTQIKEIKDMSYTYQGQLSTDKNDRNFIFPYPVWAGIKVNSSPNRIWNKNSFQPKHEKKEKKLGLNCAKLRLA